MRRWPIVACLCLFSFVVCAQSQTTQTATSAPGSAMGDTFAWFDSLGFPSLKGCPLVRVATGEWSRSGNHPPEGRHIQGFLLKEKGETFSVFTPDLSIRTFTKTPTTAPAHEQVGFEKQDLAKEAAAVLASLRKRSNDQDPWRRFGERVSERVEIFVWARACAANGLTKLASDLYDQAVSMAERRTGEPPIDFRKSLSNEIAHSMIWRAVLEFGEPTISRKELLGTFDHFLKSFPESEHAETAKEYARILNQMVKEDEEHAKQPATSPSKMTQRQRIAELIYLLRDQNGQQWSQPGACDIFMDPRGEESPAGQLVEIGYDAIPQLIEVLGDQRLTRSVGYHRDFYYSHYVLRVGDCAQAIISRIAGRGFYRRASTSGAMVKDGQVDETRKEIDAWWAEFQKKGEKQVLMEAAAAGDGNSPDQARRLLRKYRQAALDPILKGAGKATEAWTRMELIVLAGEVEGDGPVTLLLERVAKDPSYRCRVAAARGLMVRGRREAIPTIIDAWNRLPLDRPARQSTFDDDDPTPLVVFLASCGTTEAVEALGKNLNRRAVDLRLAVVGELSKDPATASVPTTRRAPAATQLADPKTAAYLQAVEALLVRELEDTEAREGMSGSYGDWHYVDPRICDMAAYVLRQRWPDKYKFDGNTGRVTRDRQRIEMINTWRKEHRQPLLPLPEQIRIKPADAAVIGPKIKAVLDARSASDRATAVAGVETLGLPALQPVRDQLVSLKADHPARAELEALSRRLALVIREVVVAKDCDPPSDDVKKAFEAAKGKSLTSSRLLEIVLAAAKGLPQEAPGLRLTVDRSEDLAGVVIEIGLLRKHTNPPGSGLNIHHSQSVTAGNEPLLSLSGSSTRDVTSTPDAYKDLVKAADKAFRSPPQCPLEFRVTIERGD